VFGQGKTSVVYRCAYIVYRKWIPAPSTRYACSGQAGQAGLNGFCGSALGCEDGGEGEGGGLNAKHRIS